MNQEFCLKLDWLAFTFRPTPCELSPIEQFVKVFPEFFTIIEQSSKTRMKSHYDVTLNWMDSIIICYNVFNDPVEASDQTNASCARRWRQGVNIQCGGHALNALCNILKIDYSQTHSVLKLLRLLRSRSCTLSRIDLAFDDFVKKYTVWDYVCFYTSNRIQSPYSNTISFEGSRSKGQTIYFGSRSHRRKLLRIYDKDKQSGGEIDSIRYEWEFHNEAATDLMNYLVDNCNDAIPFAFFITRWLRIKVPNNNSSDISAVNDDPEWLTYLCSFIPDDLLNQSSETVNYLYNTKFDITSIKDVESQFNAILVPIKIPKSKDNSLRDLTSFINNQAAPSITGYVQCFGWDALYDLVSECKRSGRVNEHYRMFYSKLSHSSSFEDDSLFSASYRGSHVFGD